MTRNLSITTRYAGTVIIAVVVQVAVLVLLALSFMQESIVASEEKELEGYYENVVASLQQQGVMAQAMSALVAGIPRVQEAFARGDREALHEMFVPGFERLESGYGVRQFQFHQPPALSFLRVHKPAKHGDDLSSFRHTVVETNTAREPITGLEVGVAGLGIRGMVPLDHQGEHQGSVEFGMSFGQPFFDEFTRLHGVQLGLYLLRGERLEVFGSTIGQEPFLERKSLRRVVNGDPVFREDHQGDTPVAVYAHEITDYSGKPIGVLELVRDRSFYVAEMSGMRTSMVLVGLVTAVVIGLLVWLISRGVVRPLLATVHSMDQIATGKADLSARLPVEGRDEVARLSEAFNRFAAKIETMVQKVSLSLGDLSSQVDDLSSAASHTNKGMQQQQAETAQVATAMNEMSSTVHEVAENTDETANAAREADAQAQSGKEVVNGTVQSIQRLAEDVGNVDTVVKRVSGDTDRIGTVLDVIRNIAEQTNLLALNAAIEAARAGEQGRGFAVVADEVRTLAQRTQESTQEIQGMIESLQRGVGEAVTSTQHSLEQTSESVDQARRAGETLDAIVASVDTITRMTIQIATASQEQSAVAEEINRNITNINALADQTAHDAESTAKATGGIASMVETVVGEVSSLGTTGSAAAVLSRAKTAHKAWKTKLRAFLDGTRRMEDSELLSDHDCSLGKWYFGEGRQNFGNLDEFRAIEAPHRELHQVVKRVVEAKRQGDLQGAEVEYEKLSALSEQIVGLIEKLEHKV